MPLLVSCCIEQNLCVSTRHNGCRLGYSYYLCIYKYRHLIKVFYRCFITNPFIPVAPICIVLLQVFLLVSRQIEQNLCISTHNGCRLGYSYYLCIYKYRHLIKVFYRCFITNPFIPVAPICIVLLQVSLLVSRQIEQNLCISMYNGCRLGYSYYRSVYL